MAFQVSLPPSLRVFTIKNKPCAAIKISFYKLIFDSVQLLFQVVIPCITQSSTHNWSPLWRMPTENDSKIPKTAYVSCFDCPCTMCWSRTIYNRMACTVGIRQPCCIHKVALKSRFQTSDGWIRELLGQARRRSCVTHLTVFVYEKNRDFPLNLRLTTNAHVTKSH